MKFIKWVSNKNKKRFIQLVKKQRPRYSSIWDVPSVVLIIITYTIPIHKNSRVWLYNYRARYTRVPSNYRSRSTARRR